MNGSPNSSKYANALIGAGAELYEVGGPVRDRLMNREPKDHDLLCCSLSVDKVKSILAPLGRVALVGKSFGVIKFRSDEAPDSEIDIALPRRELSTGSGHRDFDVDFDPNLPIEDDLGRRDFTINAMAMRVPTGEIIDLFGGQEDLKAKVLRQVFPKAFEEDPLRLLRGVQFAARFGLTIEPKTWDSMVRNAHLIETVSGERISEELMKLMLAPKPSVGINLMAECGLLKYVLPELEAIRGVEQDKQPGDDVYAHTMRVLDAARGDEIIEHPGEPELLFAALFHDTGKAKTAQFHAPSKRVVFFGHQVVSAKLARRWMGRMKLASCGINVQRVQKLIENHMFETKAHYTDKAIRRFVAKIGKELIFKLMDLRIADNRGGKHPSGTKGVARLRTRIRKELAKKPPFGAGDLAINGHDLMELGIPEGRELGRVLGELVEVVLDDPEHNTREHLLALAGQMMQEK
jgi:tRNA nucleotidyltransferase (CCA-adding enzyme)